MSEWLMEGSAHLPQGGEIHWSDADKPDSAPYEIEILPNGWVRLQVADYKVELHPPESIDAIYTHNDVKVHE